MYFRLYLGNQVSNCSLIRMKNAYTTSGVISIFSKCRICQIFTWQVTYMSGICALLQYRMMLLCFTEYCYQCKCKPDTDVLKKNKKNKLLKHKKHYSDKEMDNKVVSTP